MIYLARHGETTSNLEKIYAGRSEEGLTPTGIEQAYGLAKRLKNRHLTHIYTSPIRRAFETAEIVGNYLKIPVTVEEDLREMELGPWEGLSEDEVAIRYPEQFDLWTRRPDELKMAGRESLTSVRDRGLRALEHLTKQNRKNSILAITHVAVIRCLVLHLQKLPLRLYKSIDVPNASVYPVRKPQHLCWGW